MVPAAPALLTPESRQPLPEPTPPSTHRGGGGPFSRRILPYLPYLPAFVPVAIVAAIVLELLAQSRFHNFGWEFFGSTFVGPGSNDWGIGVFVVGSFVTAIPALFFSMFLGLGIAVASVVYLPRVVSRFLDGFVDLLAGIPSVVYGIWGYLFVAPYFGSALNPWLFHHLGGIPGFGGLPPPGSGLGLPLGVFILTLMALPITTLLIRDALRSLPRELWESGLALGATRWECLRKVALPHSRAGILSAAFLGFGRAFGETVAIAMVLNLVAHYPSNVYSGTATVAAMLFELLDSAYGNSLFLSWLAELALVLLAITATVNVVGRLFISRLSATQIAGV